MIALTSLGARRIAVAATYGHLKRRSGLEPDREFIPTSVVMEKTLIPSMFPSAVCPQTNMLLRSLDLPVNGMFWILTRDGYVLTQQLLAQAGLRFLPPLSVVQKSCPDGVLRRPDGVPCLICPPLDDPIESTSISATLRARGRVCAAALDDDATLISDIQKAGHVAMDADFASATALHSFAAAYSSTVMTMLVVIAIELLALGIPFAVRGALGEPLLGRSPAEGAAFLLVALGQATVSLNVGSGLSGAMTLYFLTTAASYMSRRGTFPPPTMNSVHAQATSAAIVADATRVAIDSGTPPFDAIDFVAARPGVSYPGQQVDFMAASALLSQHNAALLATFPLDTPSAVAIAMRFTIFQHGHLRSASFSNEMFTAAIAPVGSLIVSSVLCIYFTVSPHSISALIGTTSNAFQRAAVIPTLLVMVTMATNSVLLLYTFNEAAKRVSELHQWFETPPLRSWSVG